MIYLTPGANGAVLKRERGRLIGHKHYTEREGRSLSTIAVGSRESCIDMAKQDHSGKFR